VAGRVQLCSISSAPRRFVEGDISESRQRHILGICARSRHRQTGNLRQQLCNRRPDYRILVPNTTIKQATISALACAAPLLEEERYPLVLASGPDSLHPLACHGACFGTTFATDDSPMDAREVDRVNWSKKRLKRHKPHAGGHQSQRVYTIKIRCVFD